MKKPILTAVIVAGVCLTALMFLICCRIVGRAPTVPKDSFVVTLKHNGLDRTCIVHLPTGFDKTNPRPLVFALHGGGGTGAHMVKLTKAKFDALADQDGWIVCYPDGVDKHWNDGRANEEYRAQKENIDDSGFICALIDKFKTDYNIDTTKVYSTGISNGAMMSFRLALEKGDRFAAIAPVAGSIPELLLEKVKPSAPVSALIINGTDDGLVPYKGGEVRFLTRELGKVIPVEDAARYLAKLDACSESPVEAALPDADPNDRTKTTSFTYGNGKGGTEVILYKVDGGGHTWPKGDKYMPEIAVGKVALDFDACETVWNFFKSHNTK